MITWKASCCCKRLFLYTFIKEIIHYSTMSVWQKVRTYIGDWRRKGFSGSGDGTEDIEERFNKLEKSIIESISNAGETGQVPLIGGRSSVSEAELLGYRGIDGVITPKDFNIDDLKIIESLSIHDPHFSLAVENIVSLGNTKYEISFSDKYSDRQKREMKQHLEAVSSTWYACNEEESSLDGDRFSQLAVYGCCSTEAEIKQDLSGIKKIHRVSPNYIRFKWDKEMGDYLPVQLTTSSVNGELYTDLNTNQYHYKALRRIGSLPYAIPPFISALEDMITSKDMMKNFKSMMNRIGLLGFLTVLLKKPAPKNGISDKAYTKQLTQILSDAETQVSKGFANGYNIGFKDNHEFNIDGNTINAKGASELMEIIKKMIFSGLKQDPNLHGYNYSTTETFGKIIMEKMGRQTEQFQQIVAADKVAKYSLELMLAGFPVAKQKIAASGNPYGIKVQFAKPINANAKEDADAAKALAEAEEIKQKLILQRRNENIINQSSAANELGYNKAAGEAPEQQTLSLKKKVEKENNIFREEYHGGYKEYDYEMPSSYRVNGHDHEVLFEGFEDSELNSFYNSYRKEIDSNYNSVWEAASVELSAKLSKAPESTSFEVFFSMVENAILKQWKPKFIDANKPVVKKYVDTTYRHYRADKGVFSFYCHKKAMTFDEVPDSVFDLVDLRTIEYLQSLDNIYLGKFITDEATRQKFKVWLEELYLSDNSPITNKDLIDQFLDEFGVLFRYEAWKIVRVISTTMNKARNYANVHYINQANIEKFEIVEVMDSRTCAWCRHLNGKQFATSNAVAKIDQAVNASSLDIGSVSPFATTIPIQEFTKLDAPTLQDLGIDTPSYHPHCRGRVVAVI